MRDDCDLMIDEEGMFLPFILYMSDDFRISIWFWIYNKEVEDENIYSGSTQLESFPFYFKAEGSCDGASQIQTGLLTNEEQDLFELFGESFPSSKLSANSRTFELDDELGTTGSRSDSSQKKVWILRC